MEKFICYSEPKEQIRADGTSMGMGNVRALYYAKEIGRRRIYRNPYPNPSCKGLALLAYKTHKKALSVCEEINKVYNDTFKPIVISV